MEQIDLDNVIKEAKQNKVFWFLIFLVILSIILYTFEIPFREIGVLSSFLGLVIYVTFKLIK